MDARVRNGMAVLEEFIKQKYSEGYEKFDDSKSKIENMQTVYPNYFYIPQKENIGSLDYVMGGEGNALYLIKKSGLPEEIKESLVGGDAGEGRYTDYSSLHDVYGITSNLKIYYCSNGTDSIVGLSKEKLDKENLGKIIFESDSKMSNLLSEYDVNNDGLSFQEIGGIDTVEITSDDVNNVDFKELCNLYNLRSLVLRNVNIEKLDGIENCNKLNTVKFIDCVINDYTNIGKLGEKLENLYFYSINDNELFKVVDGLKDYSMINLKKLAFSSITERFTNTTEFWDVARNRVIELEKSEYFSKKLNSIEYLKDLNETTKKAVKYLTVSGNNLTSLTGIEDFQTLYLLRAERNQITSLENIKEIKTLEYLMMDYNSLNSLGDFVKDSKLYYFSANNNENLTSLKGLSNCLNLSYLNCLNCNLGNNEAQINRNEELDALSSLKGNSSLVEVRLTNNANLRWVDYLSNCGVTLKLLWIDKCGNLERN